jgi:cold-inducible RNA-binding protein
VIVWSRSRPSSNEASIGPGRLRTPSDGKGGLLAAAVLSEKCRSPFDSRSIMKIYVGNLSYNTTESDLRTLFAPFGNPSSVAVIMDRQTNQSKGFGFVEFEDDAQARAAIAALNGKEVGGRSLRVNEARPRT